MTTCKCKTIAATALTAVGLMTAGGCSSTGSAGGGQVAMGAVSGERAVATAAYTCPLTGEELPCPKCCPLNKQR